MKVLGNCFCYRTHPRIPDPTLMISNSSSRINDHPPLLDRLGLCLDQGEGCYATFTAVQVDNLVLLFSQSFFFNEIENMGSHQQYIMQVNITGMMLNTMPCQQVDLKTPHPDPVCLQYSAFHRLYPVLLIVLPFLALSFLPTLISICGCIQVHYNPQKNPQTEIDVSGHPSWG